MLTNSTFRGSRATTVVVFVICSTLLFSTLVVTGSGRSLASVQGQSRRGSPEAGPPEAILPNLNEVRRRVHPRPEAPPNVPSVMRGRRKPLQPRNGRKVGDPGTMEGAIGMASPNKSTTASANSLRKDHNAGGTLYSLTPAQNAALRSATNDSDSLGLRAQPSFTVPSKKHNHARPNGSGLPPAPIGDDQYVQTFFQWALVRTPYQNEQAYWNDILRAAYAHAQTSMVMAAREMGKTLFESAEYALRARSNHDYVYDLYKTYLLRTPDSGGWAYWESVVPAIGRENVRRAFDESGEFVSKVATVTPNGVASSTVTSLLTARVDPNSQSGNQIMARDAEWGVSLLGLSGRAGLDLGLTLSYSSAAAWTRSGPYIYFDDDNSSLSPGFRLGFPTVQELFFNAQTGQNAYLLITSAGSRVELRQVSSSNIYEAADSSYLQLTDNSGSNPSTLLLRPTDGSQMSYTKIENEWRCTKIKDRNGNFITVNYNTLGDLTSIIDTLGRTITFNYDGNANLSSITQIWHRDLQGGGQTTETHQWATFRWGSTTIQPNFSNVALSGIANNQSIPVLTMVGLDDGTYYKFAYANWNCGQVSRITHYASDSNPDYDYHERTHTAFTYLAADDSTRLSDTRVAAENWTGINGVPSEVITQFGFDGGSACWINSPDGTVYKEFYGSGWQKRLPIQTETWSGGIKQKWTTTTWARDNTNDSYYTNPRATDSYIYDALGNVRRTHTDYTSYGLPSVMMEYQADAANVYRITVNNYELTTPYTSRRVIGLVSKTTVFDGGWNPFSVVSYDYDAAADLQALPNSANAVQHDYSNYGTGFLAGRGNLTSTTRWDATDPTNSSKAVKTEVGYNITGAVMFQKDPLFHQSSVSYAESFSDNNNNRNTFAYPTTVTDAGGFQSFAQYNFDFGAWTRVQGPPPAGQSQGIIQTFTYDNAARLQQVTTANTGAYRRYYYGPVQTEVFSSVNNVADEGYSNEHFDGLGRVIATASILPGSAGGYEGQLTLYDLMGRAVKHSNPTEISENWLPAGDDAAGWLYTTQTYDFKGRPLVTTNPDTTTRTAAYSNCGCAGGEVVTLTDEGTVDAGVPKRRQQKIYSDFLGRTVKTEILNWQGGTVYTTAANSYNQRDQATLIRQFQGTAPSDPNDLSCPSGTCQQTTMTYDGYGRVKTKHVPEQQVDPNNAASTEQTTWDYNLDNTVQKVTDARGAVLNLTYNSRHLIIGTSYALLPSVPTSGPASIPTAAAASFAYDAAGNRTSMTDGTGSSQYSYDTLSRMTSETRQFNGVTGTFTLAYGYTLAGQVMQVSDQRSGTSFSYNYDSIGRMAGVTGAGLGGPSSLVTNLRYRAGGGVKQMDYGNGTGMSQSYNQRGLLTQYALSGVKEGNGQPRVEGSDFQYYADGRVKFVSDRYERSFNAVSNHDRAYLYDHSGRLKKALSSLEANDYLNGTQSGYHGGPFQQTYTLDAWDNIVARTGTYWSEDDVTGTQVYNAHNHNSAWTYDASGNLASMNEPAPNQMPFVPAQHTYDAAGHHVNVQQTTSVQSPTNPNLVLTTTTASSGTYDGSGQQVARTQTRQTNANTPSIQTTYFLRSSVLGGKVISDYDAQGTRTGGYVYAGGHLLYEQRYSQNHWHFVNPVTGDARDTDTTGKLINDTHLDPEGVNTGASDPASLAGGPEPAPLPFAGAYGAYLPHSLGGAGNCVVNGNQTGCAFAQSLRDGGGTEDCPDGDCEKPHQVTLIARDRDGIPIKGGTTTILVLPGQPGWDGSRDGTYTAVGFLTRLNSSKDFAADFLRAAGHPDKNGVFDVNEESLWRRSGAANPQNPTPEERAATGAADLLKNNDCGNFISELISIAANFAVKPWAGGVETPRFDPIINDLHGNITPSYGPDAALLIYKGALAGGQVTASGKSGVDGDTTTYGVTTNNTTIVWNREFYSLGAIDQALQTLHESLHLIPNFSDFVLADAAHVIATRGVNDPGTRANYKKRDDASRYLNTQIDEHCRP